MSNTKDTIIQRIMDTQNRRLELKSKMVDNNPLFDYNKGQLEYSLPWPIIGRILDLAWTESTICTCYYIDQFVNTLKVEELDEPEYVSKRVHQFLSSKNCTNLVFNPDTKAWEHLTNQYCPIKAPKSVTLLNTLYSLPPGTATCTFSSVEKLKLDNYYSLNAHNVKEFPKFFKNIKSLTTTNYGGFILDFKYLTSLNSIQKNFAACVKKELKRRLKNDLIVICQSLDIESSNRTKDSMINQIINVQNRLKMVDDNPLFDYNKG
ncbi:hypothetical protein DFA_06322 [Cavenderia fasciculata]|uniref:Uncharacterized protein n=1 Tax=Cavenderia fasciculata TaxID=261658 RepID=F4PKQ1_CACFS|nr:uncharacterized protein DFA_06322 [Cavenderia fasciculata]EGG24175.1 hypothetical protein DFA_06322 [Cavenderia fasciculata]|eukprot:XP_004362026.1 hypothetical protein DFA_06322 [Cavenderia fasciculata]